MIYGIDVSHWNQDIDWKQVAASGVRFAYLKATEALSYADGTFLQNLRGARAAGILVGAYHFFRPAFDPILQADWFYKVAHEANDLPPAIDLEDAGRMTRQKMADAARICLARSEERWQCKVMVYTNPGFWLEHLPSAQDWAAAYGLWQATYAQIWPPSIYPWAGPHIWQFNSHGRLPGIRTNVDLNRFFGTLDELAALKGSQP